MAVELADLVSALQVEMYAPGVAVPTASSAYWETRLVNAFWEARINGLLSGFIESDGTITPASGTTDISRDQQQIIVLYAAYSAILSNFQNLNSEIRQKTGPIEYEVKKNATVLKTVLDALRDRMKLIISTSEAFGTTDTAVFDAYLQRTDSIAYGEAVWVR